MAIDISKIRSRKSLETLVKEHEKDTNWPIEVKIGVVTRYLAITRPYGTGKCNRGGKKLKPKSGQQKTSS